MGYFNLKFTLEANQTVNLKMGGHFYGLLSYLTTSATAYGFYSIHGYGLTNSRTKYVILDEGTNNIITITASDEFTGYIISNTSEKQCYFDVILWRGSCSVE